MEGIAYQTVRLKLEMSTYITSQYQMLAHSPQKYHILTREACTVCNRRILNSLTQFPFD